MKRRKLRLAVLLFMLFNLLLAACAQSGVSQAKSTPVPEPTPSAETDSEAPEATPEPAAEPTPEPTPEPDEGWREAYAAVAEQFMKEIPPNSSSTRDTPFDLIDIDGDDTPELVACMGGYCVSLYTYREGETCMLMDRWAYGAMGNMGYEYCPGKNSLRNYNSDYAGLIMYTTYMAIGPEMTVDVTATIVTYNFNDANGNGSPDEDEYGSAYKYSVTYYDGGEISGEEAAAFDAGEYVFIEGRVDYNELLEELSN